MSELIGAVSCNRHSFDASFVERSDVYVQSAAYRRDVSDIVRLVRHYRAAAAREQDIGYIVHSYIICDIVYQRHAVSYIFKILS